MKIKDAIAKGLLRENAVGDKHLDNTRLLIDYYFARNDVHDYRDAVIQRAIKDRISIGSDIVTDMLRKLCTVKCPKCGKVMEYIGGGGNDNGMTSAFRCKKDRIDIGITLPSGGLRLNFDNDEDE
jgi:hypothetical protein